MGGNIARRLIRQSECSLLWDIAQIEPSASRKPSIVRGSGKPSVALPTTTGMQAASNADTKAATVIWPSANARYRRISPKVPIPLAIPLHNQAGRDGIGSPMDKEMINKRISPANSARNNTR